MKKPLSQTQLKILDIIQRPLPVCRRPFEKLAGELDCPQDELLEQLEDFRKRGLIRRFRPQIDYRALGRVATLVASSVPRDKIPGLTNALNRLPGVSHNYLRDHSLNVWFTLQAGSTEEISRILSSLKGRLGLEFFDFASVKTFKLDVRFNPAGPAAEGLFAKCPYAPPVCRPAAALAEREKRTLSLLNQDMRFVPACFDDLAAQLPGVSVEQLLNDLQSLCDKGVIRRIAAVLDHRRLGFSANAMFCLKADDNAIDLIGEDLAGYELVSHCYQRRASPDWPYNLYAMLHGASVTDLQIFAGRFAAGRHIDGSILLPTVRELKKTPVPYRYAERRAGDSSGV